MAPSRSRPNTGRAAARTSEPSRACPPGGPNLFQDGHQLGRRAVRPPQVRDRVGQRPAPGAQDEPAGLEPLAAAVEQLDLEPLASRRRRASWRRGKSPAAAAEEPAHRFVSVCTQLAKYLPPNGEAAVYSGRFRVHIGFDPEVSAGLEPVEREAQQLIHRLASVIPGGRVLALPGGKARAACVAGLPRGTGIERRPELNARGTLVLGSASRGWG